MTGVPSVDLFSAHDIAEILGCARETVRQILLRGEIASLRTRSGQRFVARAVLEAWRPRVNWSAPPAMTPDAVPSG